MSKDIELGRNYEDIVTGYSGMAIGVVHYMTGCSQALLQPRIGEDGKVPESLWFDVQRLSVKTGTAVKLDNGATPGFDKPAPKI